MRADPSREAARQARQAVFLWLAFIAVSLLVNGTIPFVLGRDLRAWVNSDAKYALAGLIIYGGLFLVAPLLILKGWPTVRQPGFLVPLALAVLAASLWNTFRGLGVLILLVLAYLHWRYNLSALGVRSSGWRGDALAILLIATLYTLPRLFHPLGGDVNVLRGLETGLLRLLGNPATSVEYLFYFGFLGSRLARRLGPILTPILIGLMYMTHEMTNPEYWYEGMQFALVWVGVALACTIFLWRRSLIPIWLGDGLARFFGGLFG